MSWEIVYEKAIRDDGSLLFPERLNKEFLDKQRRIMGSYLFANQYQNEVIPDDAKTFRKEWFRYYQNLPDNILTFGFVDPAISEADTADFTGFVVVSVDEEQNWYVRHASRHKINPTQLIDNLFKLVEHYKIAILGIEDVAFQKAVIHFAFEEMKRRGLRIPITGVKRGPDKTKEMRILGLVPRFEWGTIFPTQGLSDLELELLKFPRGLHDDLIDSLASVENIVHYPQKRRTLSEQQPSPNDPGYEAWYIKQLYKRSRQTGD